MTNSFSQPKTSPQRGAALLGVLLILGLLPWFPGVGWLWTLILGALCLLVYQDESAPNPAPSRAALARVTALAILTAAHAFQLFAFGLTSLLWLIAAIFLVNGAIGRARTEADSAAARLDFGQLRRGYRFYLALGALICLFSLFSTWGRTSGWSSFGWTGGTQLTNTYNYTTGSLELTTTYNPILYPNSFFFPGWEFSGRSLRGALWIEIALGGLLFVAALAPRDWQRWRIGAGAAWVVALIWCLPALRGGERAPQIFLLGLALCGFALWQLTQGRDAGAYDAADLAARLKKARR